MKDTAHELQQIMAWCLPELQLIPHEDMKHKPATGKWSRQEILGHLVDSAHNNMRRFIVTQYEPEPSRISYNQDFWVSAAGYQEMDTQEVIMLWKLVNERICRILTEATPDASQLLCNTGGAEHTLGFIARDYIDHLRYHMNQVIPGSFNNSDTK
jgi:hypothetical protein